MVRSCKCICFAYLCLMYKAHKTFIQKMLANHSNFHMDKNMSRRREDLSLQGLMNQKLLVLKGFAS